ncbi:olfactory receptor 5H19-like [Lethenteron reissneri]|uniref:olfactory receptor 5H19-like n=1 Tax=Lethenteron reissneri TaxID=7753 RepID=UPI002AB6CD5B|nr:olfactory receptor 5H19-like [Lethenteron reissneri]
MESNSSSLKSGPDILILIAGLLREPAGTRPLVFAVVLLFYSVALVGNLLLCAAIYRDVRLHRPMFILLANLAISDIVGCSATLPRIMRDLAAPNLITVGECVAQTIAIHFYRALECFVLSAMALDRYAAICRPLRYHGVATNGRALALRLELSECPVAKAIPSAYCDIMGLVRISCSDGSANNAYAVAVAAVTVGGSLAVVTFSYASIIYECLVKRSRVRDSTPRAALTSAGGQKASTLTAGSTSVNPVAAGGVATGSGSATNRDKAVRTCVTHMLVLTVFYAPLLFVIIYNRIDKLFPMPDTTRSALTCLFYTAPPALNPVIYGLRTGAIRRAVVAMVPRHRRAKGAQSSTLSLIPRSV